MTVRSADRISNRSSLPGVDRQIEQADRQRGEADRDVDGEQPAPRGNREDGRGDRRAGRRRDRDDHRVIADTCPQHRLGIGEAHQRTVHRHDRRGTEPLDEAADGQSGQRRREGASDRGKHEQAQPGRIDPFIPQYFAERRERQQHHRDGDLIGVHHPDRCSGARANVAGDGRQRDIGDRAVEHRHRHGQPYGGDGPIAARHRQPVAIAGGTRRGSVVSLRVAAPFSIMSPLTARASGPNPSQRLAGKPRISPSSSDSRAPNATMSFDR